MPGAGDLVLLTALLLTLPLGVFAGDLWWLLAAGREMVASGQVPAENLFSFTAPQHPWTHHEWGFALGAQLIVEHLGTAWLLALRSLLLGATLWLLHRQATRGGAVILPLLMTGATFLLLFAQATVRPWLVANLLLTAQLALLWRRDGPSWRQGLLLCGILLLWTNTHGSWMLGLGILWLETIFWVLRRPRGAPVLPVVALVSTALTFVNPYGPRLHQLVLGYLRGHPFQQLVAEWGPPDPAQLTTWVFAALLALGSWGMWRGRGKLHPAGMALVVLLAAMTLRSARNAGIFAIAATLLLSRDLDAWLPPARGWLAQRIQHYRMLARRWPGGPLGWCLALAVLALFVWHHRGRPIEHFTSPEHCPISEIQALAERGAERVAPHFQWGGCTIWAGGPQLRVFYDQRNDPYPESVMVDFMTLHTASEGWEAILDEYAVDAILWREGEALERALRERPGWQDVSTTAGVAVYVREGGG